MVFFLRSFFSVLLITLNTTEILLLNTTEILTLNTTDILTMTTTEIPSTFGLVSSPLRCHGNAHFDSTHPPNYCAYYHKYEDNLCKNSVHYRGVAYWDSEDVSDQCGHLESNRTTTILCLCNTDYCNSGENMLKLLNGLTRMNRMDSLVFESDPHTETAINLFLCMKHELGLNTVRRHDENEEESNGMSILILVIALIALLTIITIATLLVMNYRRKRYKKWLAESWDDRVKKAGEMLDGTNSSTTKATTESVASSTALANKDSKKWNQP